MQGAFRRFGELEHGSPNQTISFFAPKRSSINQSTKFNGSMIISKISERKLKRRKLKRKVKEEEIKRRR